MLNKLFSLFNNFFLRRIRKNNTSISEISQGSGSVITERGQKIAVYKDKEKNIYKFSPVCTHRGCLIQWDTEQGNWVCLCHESRFSPKGKVVSGPAKSPLKVISKEYKK